jgi:hypothetical protein
MLGSGYTSVMNSDAVKQGWAPWGDVPEILKIWDKAAYIGEVCSSVYQPWHFPWTDQLNIEVQKTLTGQITADQCCDNLIKGIADGQAGRGRGRRQGGRAVVAWRRGQSPADTSRPPGRGNPPRWRRDELPSLALRWFCYRSVRRLSVGASVGIARSARGVPVLRWQNYARLFEDAVRLSLKPSSPRSR